MRKAQIMEINSSYAVGFSKGEFLKLKKKAGMKIGDEVIFLDEDRYNNKKRQVNWRALSGVAAACIVVLILVLSTYMNHYMVYAIVTLDINPSVELKLNKQNEILSMKAMNKDGVELMNVNIEGLTIEEAVEVLVTEAVADGFIDTAGDDYILVTTVPIKKKDDLAEEIESKIEGYVREAKTLQSVNIAMTSASKNELDRAVIEEKPLGLIAISDQEDLRDIDTVESFFTNDDNLKIFEKKNKIIYKYKDESGKGLKAGIVIDEDTPDINNDLKDQGHKKNQGIKNADTDEAVYNGDQDQLKLEEKDISGMDHEELLMECLDKLSLIQDKHDEVETFLRETRTKLIQEKANYKELKDQADVLLKKYKDEWNEAAKDREGLSDQEGNSDRNREADDLDLNNAKDNHSDSGNGESDTNDKDKGNAREDGNNKDEGNGKADGNAEDNGNGEVDASDKDKGSGEVDTSDKDKDNGNSNDNNQSGSSGGSGKGNH